MICGIDPGKSGGICLLDEQGEITGLWSMPTDGRRVCPVGLAQVYREVRERCPFSEQVRVVIEEIYTPPSDAIQKRRILSAFEVAERAAALVDAKMWSYITDDHFDRLRAELAHYHTFSNDELRIDGRAGLLGYAKGAGMLHMVALWGWPIEEVKPSIWCRDIKKGVDQKLTTKEQSIKVAKSLWPAHFEKDHPLTFIPGQKRKPDDGLVEAALLAEWSRRRLSGQLVAG